MFSSNFFICGYSIWSRLGQPVTTAQNTAGSFFLIDNSVADVTNNVYLLELQYTDTADADADFIKLVDGAGTVLSIQEGGKLSIGSDPGDTGIFNLDNGAVIAFEDATEATITHVDDTGLAFNLGIDVQGAGGITLENDETITNSSDGYIALSGHLTIPDAANIGSASDVDAIAISNAGVISLSATTEASATTTAALVVAGGLGVAKDLWLGDDFVLDSDSTIVSLGADQDITITHVADTGINITTTSNSSGTINLGNDDDVNDDSIDLVLHDSGIITLYDADDDTSTSLSVSDGSSDLTLSAGIILNTIDTVGAADIDIGSPDVTDITISTDGGGADLIIGTAVADTDYGIKFDGDDSDGTILHYEAEATMAFNEVLANTPQRITYDDDDDVDQTVGTDLTSSTIFVTGDNDTDNDSIDLQNGNVDGQQITFIAIALVDSDDTFTVDVASDSTCTGCSESGSYALATVGDSVTLVWDDTASAWYEVGYRIQ